MEQGQKQEYTMENPITVVLQFNFVVSYGWYFMVAAAAFLYFAYRLLENYKQWKEAQYRKFIKKLLEQKERERQQQMLLEAQRALEQQKEKEREERRRQEMEQLQQKRYGHHREQTRDTAKIYLQYSNLVQTGEMRAIIPTLRASSLYSLR